MGQGSGTRKIKNGVNFQRSVFLQLNNAIFSNSFQFFQKKGPPMAEHGRSSPTLTVLLQSVKPIYVIVISKLHMRKEFSVLKKICGKTYFSKHSLEKQACWLPRSSSHGHNYCSDWDSTQDICCLNYPTMAADYRKP